MRRKKWCAVASKAQTQCSAFPSALLRTHPFSLPRYLATLDLMNMPTI